MPDSGINVLGLIAVLAIAGFAVKRTWTWWFATTPAFQARVKGLMPNARIMTPILGALALYLADLAFYVYGGKVFEVTYAKVPSIFWYGPLFLGVGIWAMGKNNPTAVRLGGGLAVLIVALVLFNNVPWKMAWSGDGPKDSATASISKAPETVALKVVGEVVSQETPDDNPKKNFRIESSTPSCVGFQFLNGDEVLSSRITCDAGIEPDLKMWQLKGDPPTGSTDGFTKGIWPSEVRFVLLNGGSSKIVWN